MFFNFVPKYVRWKLELTTWPYNERENSFQDGLKRKVGQINCIEGNTIFYEKTNL